MSVAEAVKEPIEGPAVVKGFLFLTENGAVLAEHLLESYPAQPGGVQLRVVGIDAAPYDMDSADGVSWTPSMVEIAGTLETGVLYIDVEDL